MLISHLSPEGALMDAVWMGDGPRARELIARHSIAVETLQPHDKALLAGAAWWYRPDALRLMLELGFDPHVTGAHDSTPLDRASFHGYADIVQMLRELDPHPPLTQNNEFGGFPIGACMHGSMHGWKIGFPQHHARTVSLLLDAGSPLDPTNLPTRNDELDTVMRNWLKHASARHGN